MRAIEAKTFSGYGGLRQTQLPKPQPVIARKGFRFDCPHRYPFLK